MAGSQPNKNSTMKLYCIGDTDTLSATQVKHIKMILDSFLQFQLRFILYTEYKTAIYTEERIFLRQYKTRYYEKNATPVTLNS